MNLIKKYLISLALIVPAASFADLAFSNFAQDGSYNEDSGWTVGLGYSEGEQFTSALSGNLTTVDAAIAQVVGTGNLSLSLYADSNTAPGTELATVNATTDGVFGNANTPTAFDFTSSSVHLTAGQNYWLVVTAPSGDWDAWNVNSIGETGNHYTSPGGVASGFDQGTFDVNVAATPEPATMAVLGAGAFGLLRRRRKV